MGSVGSCPDLQMLLERIQESIQPFAGRVEYGNLRSQVSHWDNGTAETVTNVALVYETPGGSTDQINISYHHGSGEFSLIDAGEGEFTTRSIDSVIECIEGRVSTIPAKRLQSLCDEIRRQIDSGSNTAGLVGHLNRMMNSGFKGGAITLTEMRSAVTYAMQYMKGGTAPSA